MNETSGRREAIRLICSITVSCIIGALLAAVAAAVILRYVAVEAPAKRYDDVEKILSEYEPNRFRGATIDADGSLTVRLGTNDIYWYASEFGILDRFQEQLETLERTEGWKFQNYGFRVDGEHIVIHLYGARRLPVYLRAEFDVVCQGTVMYLYPTEVAVSGYLELDPERWPSFLPKEGFRLDFAELGISRCLRSVRLEDNKLVLASDGLQQALSGQLMADVSMLNALDTYGYQALDSLGILQWVLDLGTDKLPMAEAQERVLTSGNAAAAMADLLACCTGTSRMDVLGGWDRFTLVFAAGVVEDEAMNRQNSLNRYIAAEQWKYEKLLTSLREMYKAGALTIGERGFILTQSGEKFDPAALTGSLSLTAIDSTPVLLYTDRGGAQNIRTTDMPMLSAVPQANQWVLRDYDTERIYDLGMLMTTENGLPALLHYRNDGVFVIREVDFGLYTRLLLHKGIPTLCADDLWTPEARTSTASIMGISQYEILLLP